MRFRTRVLRLAYPFMKLGIWLLNPHLRAVRVVVRDDNDVLLVRHTYGSHAWGVPGGRINRKEDPVDAGERELHEETGIKLENAILQPGNPFHLVPYKRGELWVVTGSVKSREHRTDGVEIDEIGWFPVDALPNNMLSQAVAALRAAGIVYDEAKD